MDDKRYGDPQSAAYDDVPPPSLMLRPRDSHDLRLIQASLKCSPPAALRWRYAVFGNSIPARRDLIRVAVIRDVGQAMPISGTFVGAPGEYLDNGRRIGGLGVKR